MVKYEGIGITTVLGLIFIVLKLCDVIDWSWIWVLSPFWIPWLIVLFFIILFAAIGRSK